MIALKILEIKDFMNKLLIGNDFDQFCLIEATITTFNTFSIDGEIHRDFFDTDTSKRLEQSRLRYSLWKDVKPWCLSVIRGKYSPIAFKLIFQLSPGQTDAFLKELPEEIPPEHIRGLYLNLQYRNKELLVTSGISMTSFSLNKAPDHLWDSMLQNFFSRYEISFEIL